jgi:uncharacterized protein YqgV (UPF0045/DUF77 family)
MVMSTVQDDGQGEIGMQLSVYPLRQSHLGPAVRAAVGAAAAEGLEVTVGRLSTFARGDEEAVFRALRAAFSAARSFGPTVVAITLASGLPTEETVAEIQAASSGK